MRQKKISKLLRQRFHPARLKRTADVETRSKFNHIFRAAEAIVALNKRNGGVFIFPGQSMRPLFETVKAICAVEGIAANKHFAYVVAPRVPKHEDYRQTIVLNILAPKKVMKIKRALTDEETAFENRFINNQLVKRKLASKLPGNFVVVDYKGHGITYEAIKQALKRANQGARVRFIHQRGIGRNGIGKMGKGIAAAQDILRPTKKDESGKLQRKGDDFERDYLLFQQRLGDYIKQRLKSKGGGANQPNGKPFI